MSVTKTYLITENLIANALQLTLQLQLQLEQEADNLKSGQQPATIDAIAANKKRLVADLEQFNSHLGQVLATEALPNNQQGVQDYFLRAANVGIDVNEVSHNWAQILVICTECKILNEQNGFSIELLSRHNNRALHILKGKSALSNTYGPDGATRSDLITHTLISV
jgi:flagella synthesis protein FlgN